MVAGRSRLGGPGPARGKPSRIVSSLRDRIHLALLQGHQAVGALRGPAYGIACAGFGGEPLQRRRGGRRAHAALPRRSDRLSAAPRGRRHEQPLGGPGSRTVERNATLRRRVLARHGLRVGRRDVDPCRTARSSRRWSVGDRARKLEPGRDSPKIARASSCRRVDLRSPRMARLVAGAQKIGEQQRVLVDAGDQAARGGRNPVHVAARPAICSPVGRRLAVGSGQAAGPASASASAVARRRGRGGQRARRGARPSDSLLGAVGRVARQAAEARRRRRAGGRGREGSVHRYSLDPLLQAGDGEQAPRPAGRTVRATVRPVRGRVGGGARTRSKPPAARRRCASRKPRLRGAGQARQPGSRADGEPVGLAEAAGRLKCGPRGLVVRPGTHIQRAVSAATGAPGPLRRSTTCAPASRPAGGLEAPLRDAGEVGQVAVAAAARERARGLSSAWRAQGRGSGRPTAAAPSPTPRAGARATGVARRRTMPTVSPRPGHDERTPSRQGSQGVETRDACGALRRAARRTGAGEARARAP